MAMYGQGVTRGKVAVLGIDATINQAVAAFFIKSNNLSNEFLYQILQVSYEKLRQISDARGGNQGNLSATVIKEFKIPLPPLETQKQIVAKIEKEQELVNANKQLIEIFEQKIKERIAKVWGASTGSATPNSLTGSATPDEVKDSLTVSATPDKNGKVQILSSSAERNLSQAAEPKVEYKKE